jgi:hypothetical protein
MVAVLQEKVATLETNSIDKTQIPEGLVLSFTSDVDSQTLANVFGGSSWGKVEGYLKGVAENDSESLGQAEGDSTVTISDIPMHSHEVDITVNGTTAKGTTTAAGTSSTVSVGEYTPATFSLRTLSRGYTPSDAEEDDDSGDSDGNTTSSTLPVITY